jgi:AraC-like DNA-binding protein
VARQSRHGLRQRLERAAELYLRRCYERRTAARAEEFAEHLRLTRPYLSRVVPEILGIPFRDFLRERQLAYAQRLLATTTLSTVQVRVAAAFGTHPTFYRCFKAAFGMTPASTGNRLRNEHASSELRAPSAA